MIFRQLFDAASSTYTYLLGDPRSREAVLIDPVFEQHDRDEALLRELGLTLRATLDTHCHADHVTGAWLMKKRTGSLIGLSPLYGAKNVDLPLGPGVTVRFGERSLEVRATPGHTDGCVCFVLDGRETVFTGDALMIRAVGRTDFQQGDPARLFRSIREQLFTLPGACAVYPGHDYAGRMSTTVDEEQRFNPRLGGGAREEDFVGYMKNLTLPHPKKIDVAVPANLRCGEPEHSGVAAEIAWGPVVVTYAGFREIACEWVATHRGEVHLLDVREAAELSAELGALEGAQLIPLGQLRGRLAEVPKERPVVTVCQSGKRSALASQILHGAGYARTANLAGGLLAWRQLGLPS